MDSTIQIVLLVFLIFLSGVFSASETALMSLNKIKIRKLEEDNVKGVDTLQKIMEDPSKLLSTILVANNVVNIGASSIATALFMDLVGASGVPIATLVMTITVLIFGEITPKSISTNNPEKIALLICNLMSTMMKILSPIVTVLDLFRKLIFKIFKIEDNSNQPLITEEELLTYVNVSHEEGVIEVEEKEIIQNLFAFGDLQAKQAMVNRMDMVAIEKNISYEELVKVFEEEKFTRMPVYEENIDSVIGIINIKSIAFLNEEQRKDFDIEKYMIEPFFTYEFKNVSELLQELKVKKTQMAIVLDEYGGTAGLITIENLVEEIVGDINDEFDAEESNIVKISDYEYNVKGYTSLIEVNEELDLQLESDEVDSLAGYIIEKIKRFPTKSEELDIEGIRFIVEDVEKNKINTIKIEKSKTVKNIG